MWHKHSLKFHELYKFTLMYSAFWLDCPPFNPFVKIILLKVHLPGSWQWPKALTISQPIILSSIARFYPLSQLWTRSTNYTEISLVYDIKAFFIFVDIVELKIMPVNCQTSMAFLYMLACSPHIRAVLSVRRV